MKITSFQLAKWRNSSNKTPGGWEEDLDSGSHLKPNFFFFLQVRERYLEHFFTSHEGDYGFEHFESTRVGTRFTSYTESLSQRCRHTFLDPEPQDLIKKTEGRERVCSRVRNDEMILSLHCWPNILEVFIYAWSVTSWVSNEHDGLRRDDVWTVSSDWIV